MEILEKIKVELDAFNNKKKALTESLRTEFPSLLKPLFEKSKKINSIKWTQYTPYFNDGDTCEFGVRQDELYVNGVYEDELKFIDWRMKYALRGEDKYVQELKELPDLDYDEYKILNEFKEVLQGIPDEFYKDLFGDHVEVTVTREGEIEVNEYDHD